MRSVSEPVDATAAGVIHDGFHRYQLRHFHSSGSAAPAITTLSLKVLTSPEFQRIAAAERGVLAAALRGDTSMVQRSLRHYPALRDERATHGPEWLGDSETSEERLEGSAHLLGYEGMIAARGGTAEHVQALVIHELLSMSAFDENPERSSYRYRTFVQRVRRWVCS